MRFYVLNLRGILLQRVLQNWIIHIFVFWWIIWVALLYQTQLEFFDFNRLILRIILILIMQRSFAFLILFIWQWISIRFVHFISNIIYLNLRFILYLPLFLILIVVEYKWSNAWGVLHFLFYIKLFAFAVDSYITLRNFIKILLLRSFIFYTLILIYKG